MRLEDIVLSSSFGNEQHLFKQEECTTVLCPQDVKGPLQHQLAISGQVRTLPVDQKGLDLLRMHKNFFFF